MNENLVLLLYSGVLCTAQRTIYDPQKHLIIKSAHPSPLSSYRGFFGSRPFSKINQYLIAQGKLPIRMGFVRSSSNMRNFLSSFPALC